MKTFGEILDAFESADIDMRDAYWGHPHRPSDGDLDVEIVDEADVVRRVVAVAKQEGRIIVRVAPL